MTLTRDRVVGAPGRPGPDASGGKQRRFDTKRFFDIAMSVSILAVIWPILVLLAIAVRMDSPGPAFFRQERVGLHGRGFRIHKFRSMCMEHDGALVSATGDSRVTRVGRFLRKSKLDELPQLLDVLAGTMSFVGPRPEVQKYVDLWPVHSRRIILSVRPGITDPASVVLRNEADELAAADDPERHYVESLLPRKTDMYVNYVTSRSFNGDLAIMARTVTTVVSR